MLNSLNLHQGPGLNGLFLSGTPLSREYDAKSDMTSYVLLSDYTLHIRGNHLQQPGSPLLQPETLKLVDILACKLGDSRASRGVELPLDEFLRLTGYDATEANKNAVRIRLKQHTALLGALSMDWTEENERYIHRDVTLFDEIGYRNGCVYAIFGAAMALYLRGCPSMPLPLPLLTASVRLPHSYLLGRRCLLHRAINKGPGWQSICVGSLLNACPSIPGPAPGQKWPPSVLERKVIAPFTTAMGTLADSGILSWKFREPVCRDDYDSFSNNIVEFRPPDGSAAAAPVEADNVKGPWEPFDYQTFLSIR